MVLFKFFFTFFERELWEISGTFFWVLSPNQTVSEHRRKPKALTPANGFASSIVHPV